MGTKANTAGFGNKGANDRPMTFADTLLTGRSLKREIETYTPQLKARPKARFGTKGLMLFSQDMETHSQDRKSGWKFWR